MRKRPFRFGLVAYDGDADVRRWRELARRAEGAGYSSLLMGDHLDLFLPFGGASPMLALADAASVTTTLRVGTAMLANDYRHPLLVAREAATLDLISSGRFELGLGAGWMKADYDAMGLQFDSATRRIDRLREAVQLIKLSWAGEELEHSGEYYRVRGYRGLPAPAQDPHPPLVIGGGTPRVLRIAGELADIVGIHVSTRTDGPEQRAHEASEARLHQKLSWIRDGAGDRFDALELQMTVFNLIHSDNPREALRTEATRRGLADRDIAKSVMSLVGTTDEICDELRRRRDEWGVSYITIDAGSLDEFAPIVDRLSGA